MNPEPCPALDRRIDEKPLHTSVLGGLDHAYHFYVLWHTYHDVLL
jgi:hypothetical protein